MMSFANGDQSLLLVYSRKHKVSTHGNLALDLNVVKERKVKMLTSIFEAKVQVLNFAGV